MKIRQGASLESPHVMLMLNDPDDTVLGELYSQRGNYPKVYDTQLMQGGGHIKGWFIDDEQTLEKLTDALYNLKQGICRRNAVCCRRRQPHPCFSKAGMG